MDNIINLIEQNNWDAALQAFLKYVETNPMSVDAYILGATIMLHYQDNAAAFSFISEGLRADPSNYELYMLLGDHYFDTNPDQAYLAYENALFYAIKRSGADSEDTDIIRKTFSDFKQSHNISVNNVSFVILSYNELDHTKKCIESIRSTCYKECYEIIVIDNASTDGSVQWLRDQDDITFIENKENVGFDAGCNQGIRACDPQNDIFLLNNDTILMNGSLFYLRMGLYENSTVGATGAVTNNLSRAQVVETGCKTIDEFSAFAASNNIPSDNPYESRLYLVMFAMLIKREALDKTGLLDELYSPGNFEDNDYGVRLIQNGYKCILCHNAFIYHVGSASFGKDTRKYNSLYMTNYAKFKDKWGFASDEYSNVRNDLIDMIGLDKDSHFDVLEIGCGFGETLARIRYLYPNSRVSGIEINKTVADIAAKRFDVRCEDIERYTPCKKYDFIILADVLGCLNDPGATLARMRDRLNKNGCILLSIPNAMNAGSIYELLTDKVAKPQKKQPGMGQIHPFTLNGIRSLANDSGFFISDLYTTSLPDKTTDCHREFFETILGADGAASKDLFDIYQFLIKLEISEK